MLFIYKLRLGHCYICLKYFSVGVNNMIFAIFTLHPCAKANPPPKRRNNPHGTLS